MLDRPPAGGSMAAGGGSKAACGGRSPTSGESFMIMSYKQLEISDLLRLFHVKAVPCHH